MSAFIVSHHHLQQLVEAIGTHLEPLDNPSRLGQQLWDANILSVRTRYPDEALADLPGPDDAPYVYAHRHPECLLEPLALLKLAHSYCYQSCEHAAWETSTAKGYVERLVTAMHARYCHRTLKRPMSLDALKSTEAYAAAWEM